MFKVILLFQLKVQNLTEVSVCTLYWLSNLERSALNKKYMKMTLMQYFEVFYRGEGSRGGDGGGDVRRVVFREEREEERYVI